MPFHCSEGSIRSVLSANASAVGNIVRPRVKKASLACTECRKRKSKCIGIPPPCERCRHHKTLCVLDEDSDRRRKGTLERRLDALEQDRTLLLRLVESIPDDSQDEVSKVLNFIRDDASLDEIRQFLAQSPRKTENAQQQVFPTPVYRVPARPWTSVTDDSNYVSHLISLYFTWIFPVQKWIDRDLFIEAMQSGNTDSQFCSPFLVNALLAVACCYCDLSKSSSIFNVVLPGILSFLNEAKRLLDQEEGRLSLTSFQGRCELYTSAWVMGKHMLGWQHLIEIADCARQLMARRNTIAAGDNENAQKLARTLDTAISGSFSAPAAAFPSLHKPSIMPRPTTYRYLPRDHNPEDVWCPYTNDHGTVVPTPEPAHSNCVSTGLFNLANMLTNEEMAYTFHWRLKQWELELPECLMHASLVNNAPTPAMLDMHLRYHSAVITIFEGIKTTSHHATITSGNNVQSIRLSSGRTICSLLEIFVAHWSVLYMPFIYIRYANVALSILLADLDNAESKELFVNSYTALRMLSCRFPIAKEVLQLILEKARQS
ncbi:hypothetical protein BDW62DRAFT_214378 [Aspergillus aurantiobrunneus]